jgi:hypothetical protein
MRAAVASRKHRRLRAQRAHNVRQPRRPSKSPARAVARGDTARRVGQATLLLPCGATKSFCVSSGLTVDGLLRMAPDAVADAAGGVRGAGQQLRCDGRLLRNGGATLAEAGVTSGSRIEVIWAVQGGMPKNGPAVANPAAATPDVANPPAATPAAATPAQRLYLSFTRGNLMAMLSILAAMLREGGFTGAIN